MKKLVSQCNSAANGCVCPSFLTTIEPYGTGTYTVFAQNLRQWMSLPFCLIPGNCVSFSADKHWWLLQSHLPNNKRQMLVAVFLVQRGRGYRFFIMVVLGHYPHICAFFFLHNMWCYLPVRSGCPYPQPSWSSGWTCPDTGPGEAPPAWTRPPDWLPALPGTPSAAGSHSQTAGNDSAEDGITTSQQRTHNRETAGMKRDSWSCGVI